MKHLAATAFLFCLVISPVQAAGVRSVEIPADADGPVIHAVVWTPCDAAPAEVPLMGGRIMVPGVAECEIAGDGLPLIVVSHGYGGGSVSHLDTVETLADAGFVVAALNHTVDSAATMKHASDLSALMTRPTDIRRLIDFMLRFPATSGKIDPGRIGFFGFSRGGYTGLVLAGAVPHYPVWMSAWMQIGRWVFHRGEPEPAPGYEPRIKAFVIADPLTLSMFADRESLQRVIAPLQLWSSQEGGQSVTADRVEAVARLLPTPPPYHQVENSTHLSFLRPCAPEEMSRLGDLCADPPGFDRAAFHRQFNAEVLAFLRANLKD